MLKFVSYDGEYPNLCSGTLKMELNGEVITFPEYCLSSTGSAWSKNYGPPIQGDWEIKEFPENFPEELKDFCEFLVNKYVEKGCCGGCL